MNEGVDWIEVGTLGEVPIQGTRIVRTIDGDVAIFRTLDNQLFALRDSCPHKGGKLSMGIVHGKAVTCPLHSWVIDLESGEAKAPDRGCAHVVGLSLVGEKIYLQLPRAAQNGTHG